MKSKCHPKTSASEKFPYRQMIHCGECGCFITAEEQKGHHYLRCTKKKGPCQQPYLREEEITKQIAKAIGQVAISDEWANWLNAQLDGIEKKENNAAQAQQNLLRQELARYDERLNRLLMAHLEQDVSLVEYRQVKNQLVQERRKVQETLDTVVAQGGSWLEPFRRFIKAANQAQTLALSDDLIAQRNFFRKVGSNLRLRERELHWEPCGAWQLVLNQGVRKEIKTAQGCGSQGQPMTEEEKKRRERDSNPR